MSIFPSRMDVVQSPLIPAIGELIANYPGTISLGQGVVSYPPPIEAIESITNFLADPDNHKYKSVLGISELIGAITNKLKIENNLEINDRNCIVVTAGSNMAFMNALFAITSAGDEVILNTPYYFNHEMAIKIANCHPVLVTTDENFQLCPDAIEQAITNKTRAIVTISPNNPTGVVYPRSSLEKIERICRENNIYHLSDEAYEYFTYNGIKHFSPGSIVNSESHTISLFSLSKAYGFASWRIGYMVIPQDLLLAVKKIQDTNLICPPVVSQYAALGALQRGSSYCQTYFQEITKVREMMLASLQSIPNLCWIAHTDGAFYFFLKINTSMDAFRLAEKLIVEHQVAVIPGTTFGMKNGCYLRVAYGALQPETAAIGIERLVKGLREILSQ